MAVQVYTFYINELEAFCKNITQEVHTPLLISLAGELGAGKTQIVQFMVKSLTQKEEAHSPTFSLINEYTGAPFPIYHVDLYRLENAKDLESSGFWDLFDEDALIFVEWSNLLEEFFFPRYWPRWHFEIKHTANPENRKVTFNQL